MPYVFNKRFLQICLPSCSSAVYLFGINNPFHRASLIGFNSEEGPKWFLVDPTYGQFFKKKKFMLLLYY